MGVFKQRTHVFECCHFIILTNGEKIKESITYMRKEMV